MQMFSTLNNCFSYTQICPFSKSKFSIFSLTASTLGKYKLRPERLTRLGNSNVLRLPVLTLHKSNFDHDRRYKQIPTQN